MGYSLPEGAERFECEIVSGSGTAIFRSATTVFDGLGGAVHSAESRRRKEGSGDGV